MDASISPSPCCSCSTFQQVLLETELPVSFKTFPDFHGLEESAQNGCPLCRLVYQKILHRSPRIAKSDWAHGKAVFLEVLELPDMSDLEESDLDGSNLDEANLDDSCSRFCFRAVISSSGFPLLTSTRDMSLSMTLPNIFHRSGSGMGYAIKGIDSTLALTQTWMSACLESHPECRATSPDGDKADHVTVRPTRLIDIGNPKGTVTTKLIIPNENDERSGPKKYDYAALTYAWGSSTASCVKTTWENLDEMKKGIDWSKLPITIQDALFLCSSLGIRYIWIDSLCILQESGLNELHKIDWEREAARFAKYYQNAHITISATGAADANEGLFLTRPEATLTTQPYVLRCRAEDGSTFPITICPATPTWEHEIEGSALGERGWAVQERLLSTRTLHFASNAIFWECRRVRESELLNLDQENEEGGIVGTEFGRNISMFASISTEDIVSLWYDFVQQYSRKKFTFYADRLPALSGLARLVQHHIHQGYLAGIWEHSIIYGISWSSQGIFHKESPVTSSYRFSIPSWSWASSRGAVIIRPDTGWEPLALLQCKELISRKPDTCGQVLRARLTLTSKFMVTTIEDLQMEGSLSFGKGNVFEVDPHKKNHVFVQDDVLYLDSTLSVDLTASTLSCFLLGVAHYKESERRFYNVAPSVAGALVLELTGNRRGEIEEYRRIGYLMGLV